MMPEPLFVTKKQSWKTSIKQESELQGAIISRISRGKVVLQLNGREEILTIKDPENENQGQNGAPRMESKAAGENY